MGRSYRLSHHIYLASSHNIHQTTSKCQPVVWKLCKQNKPSLSYSHKHKCVWFSKLYWNFNWNRFLCTVETKIEHFSKKTGAFGVKEKKVSLSTVEDLWVSFSTKRHWETGKSSWRHKLFEGAVKVEQQKTKLSQINWEFTR